MLRWQAGWGHARELPPATEVDGVLRVEVGAPSRDLELIVLDAVGDQRSIDRAARESLRWRNAWVTVPTPDVGRVVDRLAEHGLRSPAESGGPEWLMALPALVDQRSTALQAGYAVSVEQPRPGTITIQVTDPKGEPAASGQLGLVTGVAVPDKILVELTHRRRGLGAALMTTLVAAALDAGAREGVLMASTEGRLLYESLGWTSLCPVVIGRLWD